METDFEKISLVKNEEISKIKDLTRDCDLLRDLVNKIENNKKEQAEEYYKRAKEKEISQNNLNILQKTID